MSKLYRSASSIIYAGPTTGKSSLLKLLTNQGIRCFDVDSIINVDIPGYWDVSRKVSNLPPVKSFVQDCVAQLLESKMHHEHYVPVISSIWNEAFLRQFHAKGALPPLLVVRENPEEVSRLSGSGLQPGIPVELAEKWLMKVRHYGLRQFQHVLYLPDGVFLTDVVAYRMNQWQLTALGKQLLLDQEALEKSDVVLAHEMSQDGDSPTERGDARDLSESLAVTVDAESTPSRSDSEETTPKPTFLGKVLGSLGIKGEGGKS